MEKIIKAMVATAVPEHCIVVLQHVKYGDYSRVLVLQILEHLTENHGYMTFDELWQKEEEVSGFHFDQDAMAVAEVFDTLTELQSLSNDADNGFTDTQILATGITIFNKVGSSSQ